MPVFPRVSSILLPILREAPALDGVHIGTWIEDIDYREFPMINIRVIGGARHQTEPLLFGKSVVEMTAYGVEGLPETELLYMDALEVLYDAVKYQTQTEAGYLHSIKETLGMTNFSSLFMDSWRVQGLIAFGVRPPRISTS